MTVFFSYWGGGGGGFLALVSVPSQLGPTARDGQTVVRRWSVDVNGRVGAHNVFGLVVSKELPDRHIIAPNISFTVIK